MVVCEMCGKEVSSIVQAKVAGTQMGVCDSCKYMGNVIETEDKRVKTHTFYKKKKNQVKFDLVSNYVSIVNSALAKKGLDVHHLARAVNIKESSLHKYFTGKFKPEVEVARKLEGFLDIKIVEEVEGDEMSAMDIEDLKANSASSSTLSLGDLIKEQLKKENK